MGFHVPSLCSVRSIYLFVTTLLFVMNLSTANPFGNETDRLALLKFKESISADPLGFLNSWNDSFHFCNWYGVTCSRRHQRVAALNLQGSDCEELYHYTGNLSFLRFINLRNNSLSGKIPQLIGHLFRLQHLNLSDNILEGEIPVNLTYCSELSIISLSSNRLMGNVLSELGSLTKLLTLNLGTNNLTGGIPPSMGNLSSITQLSLAYNNLVGNVPEEIGQLKSLSFFTIGPNNLSRMIPSSLFNISSMNTLSPNDNEFEGIIPPHNASKCLISNKLALVETNSRGQSQLHFPMLLSFKYLTSQKTILWGKFQQASEIFQISVARSEQQ